jgi:hypothetical protein
LLDFPPGAVRRGVPPEPDFVVEGTCETVGIEVTELHQDEASGSSLKRQESEQMWVVREACRQVEESGVKPLNVAVHFAPAAVIAKADRKRLASQIANLVSQWVPTCQETATIENPFDGSIPDGVLAIRVSRLATRHQWSAPSAGYVMPDFREALQTRIEAKAKRHRSYVRACERCWLLVVADGFGPSSLFDMSSSALSEVYEAPFERMFFLEAFSGNCCELPTQVAG